jgi:hypothetical protein
MWTPLEYFTLEVSTKPGQLQSLKNILRSVAPSTVRIVVRTAGGFRSA